MAIILVTYDLKAPGRNYEPVHSYLRSFTHCKQMESLWLLDTTLTTVQIRDALSGLIDRNDTTFVVRLSNGSPWNSWNYACADWLNSPVRNW